MDQIMWGNVHVHVKLSGNVMAVQNEQTNKKDHGSHRVGVT